MSENETKAVVKAEVPDLSIKQFGTREDVAALARRIQTMLPGGDKLTTEQTLSLAQYSIVTGANPFRGEVYAIPTKIDRETGKATEIALDDGYKLLVRWARRQCEYTEWYEPLTEGVTAGDVGYTCFILRKDKHELLATFLKTNMEPDRAMDIVTISAGGVVRAGEMTGGRCPKGWTWHDVARKRALKNALNKSHGAPSLQEIANESWRVEGRDTEPEDWEGVTVTMSPAEAEATAEYNANLREMHEAEPTVANAPEAIVDLFGEDDLDEPLEGVIEPTPAAYVWTKDDAQRFFHWTRRTKGLEDAVVLKALGVTSLSNYHGTYEDAVAAVENYTIRAEDAEQIPFPEEAADAE